MRHSRGNSFGEKERTQTLGMYLTTTVAPSPRRSCLKLAPIPRHVLIATFMTLAQVWCPPRRSYMWVYERLPRGKTVHSNNALCLTFR